MAIERRPGRRSCMTRRRAGVGAILVVFAALITLGVVHLWQDPPIGYYFHVSIGTRLLPEKHIRRAFRYVTDQEMPEVVRNARAIWFGGREPRMFVRFDTDPNGIACTERTFGTPEAECQTLGADMVNSLIPAHLPVFSSARFWQERAGVSVFDPNSLGAGRWIRYCERAGIGWEIYIDDEHATVYVYAWPHT